MGLSCCRAFFYLGQGMCFMSFWTSRGDILSFSRALSDCLCMAPRTHVVTLIRGLTFHLAIFSV